MKYNLDGFNVAHDGENYLVTAWNKDDSKKIELYRGVKNPMQLDLDVEWNIVSYQMLNSLFNVRYEAEKNTAGRSDL